MILSALPSLLELVSLSSLENVVRLTGLRVHGTPVTGFTYAATYIGLYLTQLLGGIPPPDSGRGFRQGWLSEML